MTTTTPQSLVGQSSTKPTRDVRGGLRVALCALLASGALLCALIATTTAQAQQRSCRHGCEAHITVTPQGMTRWETPQVAGRTAAVTFSAYIAGKQMNWEKASSQSIRLYGHGIVCEATTKKRAAPVTLTCGSIAAHPLRVTLKYVFA